VVDFVHEVERGSRPKSKESSVGKFSISYKVEQSVTVVIDADDREDAGDAAYVLQTLKPVTYDRILEILMGRDPYIEDADIQARVTFVSLVGDGEAINTHGYGENFHRVEGV
jgi:hypothetical protein